MKRIPQWWVVAGLVLPSTSAAARAAGPVLIESHERPRTPRMGRIVGIVAQALTGRVQQGASLRAGSRGLLGRKTAPLGAARLSGLVSAVKSGAEHSYAGEWKLALAALSRARQGLAGDVLSIARQRGLFRALQRARLLLAQCHLRMNAPRRAWAMMREALQAQPDLSPAPALYGPPLQQLFYRVKAQLELQKGRLTVQTDPAGALVFLGGRSVGFSPVTVTGLYPGTHDVLAVRGKQVSRIRRVAVSDAHTVVKIDLALDVALRGSSVLRLAGEQRPVLPLAVRLGALLRVERVLLVGVRRVAGREVVMGQVVSVGRRAVIRTAYVFTEGGVPSEPVLRNLGRSLLDLERPGPGLVVRRTPPRRVVARVHRPFAPGRAPARARRAGITGYGIAGWILLGAGLGSAAVGGVLLGIDVEIVHHLFQDLHQGMQRPDTVVAAVQLAVELDGDIVLAAEIRHFQPIHELGQQLLVQPVDDAAAGADIARRQLERRVPQMFSELGQHQLHLIVIQSVWQRTQFDLRHLASSSRRPERRPARSPVAGSGGTRPSAAMLLSHR